MKEEAIAGLVTTANVLGCAFIVMAACVIVFALLDIARLCANKRRMGAPVKKGSKQLLDDLKRAGSSREKANILVALILAGYILNHTIGNGGEKYDDDRQQARFKRFLTPAAVEKLNSMNGTVL